MIHLRPLVKEELETISDLALGSSTHPWPLTSMLSSFDAGYHCLAIMNHSTWVGSMVVLAIPGKAPQQAELLNLVVFAPFQAKGFATRALEQLLATLRKDQFETLLLEVRQSNCTALKLYHALGFAKVGERKAYYSNENGHRETAILMQLSLN